MSTDSAPLLEVTDLRVHFPTADGVVKAVDGSTFTVRRGETLGVVGESGSGKSITFLTVMGLINRQSARISGSVRFEGREILDASADEMRGIRGARIGMIFQDPMTSLHPMHKVGDQIAEVVRTHTDKSKSEAHRMAVEALREVGIPSPETRARQYPHEFSGGMRQRAMIAMALVMKPSLLIADEPTTALDVMVQAQVLALLAELQRERGLSLLFITHDLSVLTSTCQRLAVMYAGRIVEEGLSAEVFAQPEHPYTRALAAAFPTIGDTASRMNPQGLPGDPPDPSALPTGCPFHPRCDRAVEECATTDVMLRPVAHGAAAGWRAACVHVGVDHG